MTDLTVTAAQVAVVDPDKSEIKDYIAGATITKGQAVYVDTNGNAGVADANASGKQQFKGIALNTVASGQAVSVLQDGECYGFTLTSLNVDQHVLLSDTAGKLNDQPGTLVVYCGYVSCLADKDLSKVLRIRPTVSGYWT